MHIHHIDPSKYGSETLEDVVPLCSTCHKHIEWLLKRTKNKVDINVYTEKIKEIYLKSKDNI